MRARAWKDGNGCPVVPAGRTGRVTVVMLLGLSAGLGLWMGCAEEPVSPSAPPFEPSYFIESVSASPGQVGVGGSSSTISALVVDRDGNPAEGVAVVFDAESWGTIVGEAVTDSSGVATAVFTSGQSEGLAKIIAHVGAFSRSTVVLVGQGSLEASPSILLANGLETSLITAKVINAIGRADSGTVVAFQTTAGSITPRGVADAAGVVMATLTGPASREDISAVVTATVESGDPQSQNDAFGITLVTFKGITLEVGASPLTIPADGSSQSTLTAVLKETSSMIPIAGEAVRFASDKGVVVGEAETDERGHGIGTLTSSMEPGAVRVIASYGNTLADTVEVVFSSLALSLSAEPPTVRGDGVSQVEVRAVLKDLTGEALPQRIVGFDTNVGLVTASDTTNSSGLTMATFTAPAVARDTTAIISVSSLGVVSTLEIPVRGLSLVLTAEPATLVADGSSQSEVRVTLREATSGEPIPSEVVWLETNLGSVDSMAVTNSEGVAAATFHGGPYTGTATIRAEYGGGVVSTAMVEVVEVEIASIVLSARPGAIYANGWSNAHVLAFVKDSGNRAVPDGLIVKFYTSSGLITAQALTESGIANAVLTSGTGVESGVEVVAVCQGMSDTTHVDFIPGVAASMELSVMPDSIPADGSTTASLIATVQDSIGHPVKDKTLVTFMIVVDLADTSAADTVIVSSTTTGGIASTSYTAATHAGLAIIKATVGDVSADATLVLTASGVSSIVLSSNRPSITVQGVGGIETATVTAEVRDKNGNPVAEGTEVGFSIISGPGGPTEENLNNQGWGPVEIPTANGRASVTLSAGTESGIVGLLATCGGVEAQDAEITIDSGPPDTLMTSVNLGLVSEGGDGIYSLIVATIVRDQYGNPVENGNAVYYDIGTGEPHVMIEGNAHTGNDIDCNQTWPAPAMKGVARTCLSFTSEAIFENVRVYAHAFNGQREISTYLDIGLPLFGGEILITASPRSLGNGIFSSVVIVSLTDKYDHFIDSGVIDFYLDTGRAICEPWTVVTDESGTAFTTVTVPGGEEESGLVFAVIARLRGTSLETSVDLKVD